MTSADYSEYEGTHSTLEDIEERDAIAEANHARWARIRAQRAKERHTTEQARKARKGER